jgi:glycosyltransferase involved in cell wall biosynthesis
MVLLIDAIINGYGGDYVDVTLACDIMTDFDSSIQPAIYLADELVRRGYTVSMMSPVMSVDVEERLFEKGIKPVNLRVTLFTKSLGLSLSWFEAWAWEASIRLNSYLAGNGSFASINFSQMISVPSQVWYLQGSPSVALRDIEKELPMGFKVAYKVFKPIIESFDEKLISKMRDISAFVIANSKFCASMYSTFGVNVNEVIYPPLDCSTFCPTTSNPSSNYVLTYLGKETKPSVVKRIANAGVKIKAFGSKAPFIRRDLVEHPNIEFLGRVTTSKLLDVYSNALFMLFTFTHEPFGYVPLESIACGTSVLTYNSQGPSEYLTDAETGWLVQTDDELVQKAVELWKNGYPSQMRSNCVNVASKFDVSFYLEKWFKILSNIL